MARPKTSAAYRAAVHRVFGEVSKILRSEGRLPADEISRLLGISKQMAYVYLQGKSIPNPDRLASVLREWDVKLRISQHEFTGDAFGRPRGPQPQHRQLSLAELKSGATVVSLPGGGTLSLRIAPGSAETIEVSVRIPKAS